MNNIYWNIDQKVNPEPSRAYEKDKDYRNQHRADNCLFPLV